MGSRTHGKNCHWGVKCQTTYFKPISFLTFPPQKNIKYPVLWSWVNYWAKLVEKKKIWLLWGLNFGHCLAKCTNHSATSLHNKKFHLIQLTDLLYLRWCLCGFISGGFCLQTAFLDRWGVSLVQCCRRLLSVHLPLAWVLILERTCPKCRLVF